MEYEHLLKEYTAASSDAQIAEIVAQAVKDSQQNLNADVYKFCFSAIDLTTLMETDSDVSVERFVNDAVELPRKHEGLPNVASICVYPTFVDIAGLGVEGTTIGVTSVAGGFPSSQTFLEVKMLEVSMAVENGADEIDVVINVGELMQGEYNQMANDLEMMRKEAGEDITFKVILETNALKTPELIKKAALLAMFAGADFVKTSTGKNKGGATPEAAVV
ncbi:MAG: deoxyribose-phosphate aldolase, partial [Tidjanibacter sp.]|nr:deoxyribose-phosphate aldolase [Tidjanibacter sp.]